MATEVEIEAANAKCSECKGKGQRIVKITNHGERDEFYQKTCHKCQGTGRANANQTGGDGADI